MENKKATRGELPTLEEIKLYCEEIKSSVDPNAFFLYYSNKSRTLKDWKKAIQIWERCQPSSTSL